MITKLVFPSQVLPIALHKCWLPVVSHVWETSLHNLCLRDLKKIQKTQYVHIKTQMKHRCITLIMGKWKLVPQLRLTLCDPTDCSLPGSSVHGFSSQEYWSGLPCPPPGDLLNPGIEPGVSCIEGRFFSIWVTIMGSQFQKATEFIISFIWHFGKSTVMGTEGWLVARGGGEGEG